MDNKEMKKIVIVVILFVLFSSFGCCANEEAEKKCISDCNTFGLTYTQISRNAGGCESIHGYSCWCRRTLTESISGQKYEPVKIW